MRLEVKHDGCRRELPREFARRLKAYNEDKGSPKIRVVWNPAAKDLGGGRFDPRWEVWIELTHHQLTGKEELTSRDRYEEGRFWRFLQSWQGDHGEFLPLDDRFFQALRAADTWADREHYRKRYEEPEEKRMQESWRTLVDAAGGVGSYWQGWGKTMVGAATRGDWRASQWWR